MSDAAGLRRVLERVAPAVRAENARGTFSPSAFATPLSVAAYALEHDFTIAVTATSNEAEQLRDSVAALLGPEDDVALWPGWDTHPLERVSPDNEVHGDPRAAALAHRGRPGAARPRRLGPLDRPDPLARAARGATDRPTRR